MAANVAIRTMTSGVGEGWGWVRGGGGGGGAEEEGGGGDK